MQPDLGVRELELGHPQELVRLGPGRERDGLGQRQLTLIRLGASRVVGPIRELAERRTTLCHRSGLAILPSLEMLEVAAPEQPKMIRALAVAVVVVCDRGDVRHA